MWHEDWEVVTRKAVIILLAFLASTAAWLRLISIPLLFVGIIAFLATSRQQKKRRKARLIGLGLTLVLLFLWLTSMRYTFGYIGSFAGVYFESGAYTVFATHGQMPATGWIGVGRSRWSVIWWFDVPALYPMTAVWIPLVAVLIPTSLLCLPCRRFPAGHCQECGYDLTGNVSGVCPECGMKTRRNLDPPARQAP